MPEARSSIVKPAQKSKDFTGKERERLQREAQQELVERQDEISLANALEAEAKENDVIDVTQNSQAPVVVDEVVELVDDDEHLFEVVRVAEDVEQATIASHLGINTYDFKHGYQYKVPVNVAFVLRERGLLYDRA